MPELLIRSAKSEDVPLVLSFIRQLAEYERLSDACVVTEEILRASLFGARPAAEVVIGYEGTEAVGFAVFFHNFSTFLGRAGIYLEDLFVNPEKRGRGYGKALLSHLAKLAVERGCGRLEWSVLDWNEASIRFYKSLGAVSMDDWTIYRVTGDALTQLSETSRKP